MYAPLPSRTSRTRRVRRSGADSSRKGNPGSPRNNASQSVTQEMAFRVLRLKGHVGTQLADRGFAAELGLDWKTWVSLSRTRCRNGPNHGAASKHKRKKEARHKSRKHTSEEAIPFLCRVLKARKVVLVGGQTMMGSGYSFPTDVIYVTFIAFFFFHRAQAFTVIRHTVIRYVLTPGIV